MKDKTNKNYIDEVLEEFDRDYTDTVYRINSGKIEDFTIGFKTFIKQKFQEQQKQNNSGRKMYQQGQKDKVEEIIEILDSRARQHLNRKNNTGDEQYGILRAIIDEIEEKSLK